MELSHQHKVGLAAASRALGGERLLSFAPGRCGVPGQKLVESASGPCPSSPAGFHRLSYPSGTQELRGVGPQDFPAPYLQLLESAQ